MFHGWLTGNSCNEKMWAVWKWIPIDLSLWSLSGASTVVDWVLLWSTDLLLQGKKDGMATDMLPALIFCKIVIHCRPDLVSTIWNIMLYPCPFGLSFNLHLNNSILPWWMKTIIRLFRWPEQPRPTACTYATRCMTQRHYWVGGRGGYIWRMAKFSKTDFLWWVCEFIHVMLFLCVWTKRASVSEPNVAMKASCVYVRWVITWVCMCLCVCV